MDHIDLADIHIGPGRAAEPLLAVVERELEPADLVSLGENRHYKMSPLQQLRYRHHALARAIAAGMKIWEAATAAGYAPNHASRLMDDPSFRELVAFYRSNVSAEYADLHERLAGLSHTAAEILAERLEDDPDSFNVSALHDTIKIGADRTGYGPQSSSVQTNVNVNIAGRLEAARKRVSERTIELLPNESAGAAPSDS